MSARGRIVSTSHGLIHVGGRRKPTITARTHPSKIRTINRYATPGGIQLPTAPTSFDFSQGIAGLRDILGNDQLGDCTAAGALHMIEVVSNLGGAPVTFQRADAIAFYEATTGYNPADPSTDQGGDEYTVLGYLRDHGTDGKGANAIAGFVAVDPQSSPDFLRSVAYNFGALYFGAELFDAWIGVGDGGVWDVVRGAAPDQNDGHCFVMVGATADGIIVDTWGRFILITWAAIAAACDELFAVLSPQIVSKLKAQAPDGLAWDALEADFNGLGQPVPPTVSSRG